jgi:hypothetical protein
MTAGSRRANSRQNPGYQTFCLIRHAKNLEFSTVCERDPEKVPGRIEDFRRCGRGLPILYPAATHGDEGQGRLLTAPAGGQPALEYRKSKELRFRRLRRDAIR